jgi:arylsulfatase B
MSSRREFLLAGSLACAQPSSAAADAPNVVLIMTDDQGYGDLACHGNPVLRTPNIDKLHAGSVRLTNYHVSPTCAPTRAALLTGRYTNATGAWHTIMGRSLLRPGEVTLADCFRASGYRTGIFGKWHLGDNYPCRPQDRGFDETLVHGGGGIWQTPDYFTNDYFDDTYWHNGRLEKFSGFCTDVWFTNAMRFIDDSRKRNKPFFAYVTPNAPHGPYWSPAAEESHYKDVKGVPPGFFGMIENIDTNVGRMVKHLEDNGLLDNTILIFTTDNGSAEGEKFFNAGMRGMKGSAFEGGHRVPFFIHWPKGKLTGGRDIGALTAHIDILPTLRDLCGLKRPASAPDLHGRSLKPLLYEEKPAWTDRAIVTDSQRLENLVKWRQASVMTQKWRLVNPSPGGNPDALQLFDLEQDPGQKTDVAAANPAIVTKLQTEYGEWWQTVSARSDEYVRVGLGSPRENPSRLTSHDWHGAGSESVWNQRGIRLAPAVNGFWAVNIERAGKYRFELRRWPREVDLPIVAPFQDSEPNREKTPGRVIDCVRAEIRIAGVERSVPVGATDKAAVFELTLKAGPAELHTALIESTGASRGAYFVYVERL